MRTRATPAPVMRSARAALVERSIARPRMNGPRSAMRTITELPFDMFVTRTRVPNGAKAIPNIVSALEGRGFDVASVVAARPSLDDVYLYYTGRDFATEDAERS